MAAVADTSPLILLAKVNRLTLLQELYGEVLVPPLVAMEVELPGAVLVMDDAEGRRVAQRLGVRVTGVLGVLIEAKVRSIIPAIAPILDQLAAEGFWLSEAMRRSVLDAA